MGLHLVIGCVYILFLFLILFLLSGSHFFPFLFVQEDKEPVFDSVKTIVGMLEVCAEFAQNVSFNRDKIQKALPAGHLDATTLADYLVKKASVILLSTNETFFSFQFHFQCDWKFVRAYRPDLVVLLLNPHKTEILLGIIVPF